MTNNSETNDGETYDNQTENDFVQHLGHGLKRELATSPQPWRDLLPGTLIRARRLRRRRAAGALMMVVAVILGATGTGWFVTTQQRVDARPPVAGPPAGTIVLSADTPEGPTPYVDYVDSDGVFRGQGGSTTPLAVPDALLPDDTTHFVDTMAGVFTYSRDSQGGIQVALGAGAPRTVDVDPNSRPVAYRGGVVWQATNNRALVVASDGTQSYRKVPAGWNIVGATLDHLWAQASSGAGVATVELDGDATPVSGFSQVNFSSLEADAVVLTNGTCSTVLAGKTRTQVGPQICGRVLALDLLDDHMSVAVIPADQPTVLQVTDLRDGTVRQTISVTDGTTFRPPSDAVFDRDGALAVRIQLLSDGLPIVALATIDTDGQTWRSTGWTDAARTPLALVTTNVI